MVIITKYLYLLAHLFNFILSSFSHLFSAFFIIGLILLPIFSVPFAYATPGSDAAGSLIISDGSYNYNIDGNSDHYFKFKAERGDTISGRLIVRSSNIDLTFLDSSQNSLMTSSDPTEKMSEEIVYLINFSGFYYLKVSNQMDKLGSYTLIFSSPAPGKNFENSLEILDSTYVYTIHSSQSHYYHINVLKGMTIAASTSNGNFGNTDLYLYDGDKQLISISNIQGNAKDSIQYSANVEGTYFLKVVNKVPNSQTYSLTVSFSRFAITSSGWGTVDSPREVSSGTYNSPFNVSFRQDTGYTLSGLKATLFLSSPFSSETGSNYSVAFLNKTISPGNISTFNFKLNVDHSGKVGIYTVPIMIEYLKVSDDVHVYQNPINSTVNLEITAQNSLRVDLNTNNLKPGVNNYIDITATNDGLIPANSIQITLDIPRPLVSSENDSNWSIPSLAPNSSISKKISIFVPSLSVNTTHSVLTKIVYKPSETSLKTIESNLTLTVSPVLLDVTLGENKLIADSDNVISIKIKNNSQLSISNIDLDLDIPSPLVLIGTDNHWFIDKIDSDEFIEINPRIYVPESSKSLTYSFQLNFKYENIGNVNSSQTSKLNVYVSESTSNTLVNFGIKSSTPTIISTHITPVQLSLFNSGNFTAEDITVNVSLPPEITLIGLDNVWYFSEIKSDENVIFELPLLSPIHAIGSGYPATFNITYYDSEGNEKNEALILGFSVRGYVNLEISDLLINPDPSIIGKTSSISGIMLNSGIVPAKSVKINIVDDGPFSSSNTGVLISDIQEDGQVSFSLEFDVDDYDPDSYPLTLQIDYTDDIGDPQSSSVKIRTDIIKPSIIQQVETDDSGPLSIIYSNSTLFAVIFTLLFTFIVIKLSNRRNRKKTLINSDSS